jgi:calmodulin
MTHNLSPEEISEFREIFNLVDRDGGGTITKEELQELMDTLQIRSKPEEIEQMINDIDKDKSGTIDFEEFVTVMSRKVNTSYTSEQVKQAFKVFEGNSPSGHVKPEILVKALMTYGTEKLSESDAEILVAQLGKNGDGLVNYEDYVSMMMS